jgi:hypothetical protein
MLCRGSREGRRGEKEGGAKSGNITNQITVKVKLVREIF